jgi:hypothetical protein
MKPHEPRSGEPEEPADGGSDNSRAIKTIKQDKHLAAKFQASPTAPPLNIPSILLEGDHPSGDPALPQSPKDRTGPAPKAASSEANGLPQAYGAGRLWLVPRDPHCLYARWDLTEDAQQQFRVRAHDNALVVRIHPENQPSQTASQIHVTPELRHSFVHVDVAGCNYVAELGYHTPEGEWTPVSVSAPARTPVETIAEPGGVQFASFGMEQPLGTTAQQDKPEADVQPVPPGQGKGTLPEPQPVRADLPPELASGVVSRATQLLFAEPGFQPAQGATDVQAERPRRPPGREPSAQSREWTTAHEQALAKLMEWSLVQRRWPGSAEIAELLSGRQLVSTQAGQREFPALSEAPSSPVGGERPTPPGFWFNLNAELVVFGATEPNAQVTLGGHLVQLREDGTFSLRFALPDGKYVLSAAAYSARGETRGAELEVERNTRYHGEVGIQPPSQRP